MFMFHVKNRNSKMVFRPNTLKIYLDLGRVTRKFYDRMHVSHRLSSRYEKSQEHDNTPKTLKP